MWAVHSYSFLNLLHVIKVNTLILRYYVPLSIRIPKNWKGGETISFRDLWLRSQQFREPEGEWVDSKFLQLRVCVKNLLLLFREVLSVLMSKGVLGESLPESLGSRKGEISGFVPPGRGGALGATRAGLVGKFWNILCCYNWAFCKFSSSNSYSCNKCSACCQISGGLELPWNGRITALMRAHGGQKSIGIFFPRLAARSTFSWPGAKFLNQNYLHQGTKGYSQPLSEGKPLFTGMELKVPEL